MDGKSPEEAFSVDVFNRKVEGWIDRLGSIWVEGQLAQVNFKSTWTFSYLTLRDTDYDYSTSLTVLSKNFASWDVQPGDRVLVHGQPKFYHARGTFSLFVDEIRKVGVGELLLQIERLRQSLISQGLCDASRKKPLPFLPRRIGLITGKASAAERDVLEVSRRRWPEVDFRVINTQVQGSPAVEQIIQALHELDSDPSVDVIIIARGGGSVEDLLPFSHKDLAMAVVEASTPVVSAIGHEPDNPVLDNVADVRAATPTDAAKIVVPDIFAEREWLAEQQHRLSTALEICIAREQQLLSSLTSRPVLKAPHTMLDRQVEEIQLLQSRMLRTMQFLFDSEKNTLRSLESQLKHLGPYATLERGYAIVQVGNPPDEIVDSIDKVSIGNKLTVRLIDGVIDAAALAVNHNVKEKS